MKSRKEHLTYLRIWQLSSELSIKKIAKEEYRKYITDLREYIDLESLGRISNFSFFYIYRILVAFPDGIIGIFIVWAHIETIVLLLQLDVFSLSLFKVLEWL